MKCGIVFLNGPLPSTVVEITGLPVAEKELNGGHVKMRPDNEAKILRKQE